MKTAFIISFLLILLCIAVPALAQTYVFDEVGLSIDIPGKYTVITPQNAGDHVQLLLANGYNADEVADIFAAEGILLQAWNASADVCFELSAIRDTDASTIFDIDKQTAAFRSAYRKEHLKGDAYKIAGYKFMTAAWKKTAAYGRVLIMKYSRHEGSTPLYNGYMRKTVKNGYTIIFDMKIYHRKTKAADNTELDTIMKSVKLSNALPSPGMAGQKVTFTSPPPSETNVNSFTVTGKGEPGLTLIGSLARLGTGSATNITATINKKGEFSMPVRLPAEGVYVLTITVRNGDEVVQMAEDFSTIKYDSASLPVSFTSPIPTEITEDKLIISGTSVHGAKVQLLYGNTRKTVTVRKLGVFSFKVDTSKEGVYNFTLVFAKKGLQTRREQFSAVRVVSDFEKRNAIRKSAIKPAYKQLLKKINGYDGKTMVYSPYLVNIEQDGPDWILTMALTRTKAGVLKDFIMVSAPNDPGLTVGSKHKMYLRCIGTHTLLTEGGSEHVYPHFELLFIE